MKAAVLATLASLEQLYPNGIPHRAVSKLPEKSAGAQRESCRVLFFVGGVAAQSFWERPEGALLDAAITRGMKLSRESIRLISIAHERGMTATPALDTLPSAQVIMIFGSELAKFLRDVYAQAWLGELNAGGLTLSGVPVIVAADLCEVLRESAGKKELWADIQSAMAFLA